MNLRTASMLALAALSSAASAQFSTWTSSLVGGVNIVNGGGITPFDQHDGTTSSSAGATRTFTGKNRAGATQTMGFTGSVTNSSSYGRLRSDAQGTVTNSYYNASNPIYANGGGGVTNPNGSPDGLVSLGFAGFDDTLQYGGSLQSGYLARYVFHVDGFNTGQGYLADLAVTIANDPAEAFFAGGPGFNQAVWATSGHAINGITPQAVHVQFSSQFVLNTYDETDGGTYTGRSDFSSTLTLDHIDVVDANGDPVSGVTVTSSSGTVYAVPEPAPLAALALAFVPLVRRRWEASDRRTKD